MSNSSPKESDLEKQLAAACSGLVYVSETDSPVEPFRAKKLPNSKSTEVEFDNFFESLTTQKDWYTEAERKNAEGFARLRDLLKAELEDLHIYKIGNVQIEIVAIGRDKNGELAGVRMKAVET